MNRYKKILMIWICAIVVVAVSVIVALYFAVNEFYRNNDDFINPDLQERLVIGDDSISIFTYDIKNNFFEIRDNIGTENIFSSFSDFSSFLIEIMDSCS